MIIFCRENLSWQQVQRETENLSSCNVVFLIFPIHTTFQSIINTVRAIHSIVKITLTY